MREWLAARAPKTTQGLALLTLLVGLAWGTWAGWTPWLMDRQVAFAMGVAWADEDPSVIDPWGRRLQVFTERVGCCGEGEVFVSSGPNGRAETAQRRKLDPFRLGGDDLARAGSSVEVRGPLGYFLRFGRELMLWLGMLSGWWLVGSLLIRPRPNKWLGGFFHFGTLFLGSLTITAFADSAEGRRLLWHFGRAGLGDPDLVHPAIYLVPLVGASVLCALRSLESEEIGGETRHKLRPPAESRARLAS